MTFYRKLLVGSLAAMLTLGGVTACGDGVDQDNGVDDGEKNDEMDDKNKETN
ncbi:hypothetical protein ACFQPF_14655 [Fictibacillus iocasae]|jgi:hypothetical protein|uniref:Uncharacterized protein n=1 Tax=Fictibacillus iocasae TaxID=2715437 RepID=A0ABW2NR19_9BACL|nr:hypothetical protein [Fictibacillus aquaticus]